MIIVCLSDTHELHREVEVPPGDLLIHAGDFSFFSQRRSMLRDFDDWLGELPHKHKIVIPGNHEFAMEQAHGRGLISNATLLVNSGINLEGMQIWGAPFTPISSGAFAMPDAAERKRHWAGIPPQTQVLVTHAPAFGILDQESEGGESAGDTELLEAVKRVRPKLHVFGHVHAAYGCLRTQYSFHVNAALFDDEIGELGRKPIVVALTI